MRLELHPRQGRAFLTRATEVLYGGAAGGGKSHLMRAAAIAWSYDIPGLQVYIFRRTSPDLFKNHMEGPSGFPSLLAEWVRTGFAKINYGKGFIEFGNKSKIHLCHCQYEKDVYNYQGAEIHVLMPDELTHFSRTQYVFLRSRVRLGALDLPEKYRGRFPRIVAGSNPGGVGHNWVKSMFVDFAPPMETRKADKSDGGMLRQFIPARLEDNPTLIKNDPEYEERLEGLGNPALVRAMRGGDWDIVAGGMFDDVWDRRVHVLPSFPVPESWRIDRACDWGSSKPFSIGWWGESDGTPIDVPGRGRMHIPRGSLVRLAEWYGWDGKTPNTGIKWTDIRVAQEAMKIEKSYPWGARVKPGPADSMIFDVHPGQPSIAETYAKAGLRFEAADKSAGSRVNGWQALRRMLDEARKDHPEEPCLYVTEGCQQFIRTVPVLPRDPKKPDDVDTDAEDHVGDETRYRVLAPRRTARGITRRMV